MVDENSVKDFYAKTAAYEWKRVVQDAYHRLEFGTTMLFARKYLPKRGRILDAGGGPGRYAIELAKLGYDVDLVDLTPANIELARKMVKKFGVEDKISRLQVADIMDLSAIKSSTFDAVMCLGGPISHIEGAKNRDKAISELARVAKRGAPIFINVFGRIGELMLSVQYWPDEINLDNFRDVYETGDDHMWQGKYYAHYFLPEEIEQVLGRNGLELVQLVGLEGIGANKKYVNLFAKRDKEGWKRFIAAHDKLASHPASVGMSAHILAICKTAT